MMRQGRVSSGFYPVVALASTSEVIIKERFERNAKATAGEQAKVDGSEVL